MNLQGRYSLWLMPDEFHSSVLQRIIGQISDMTQSTSFQPHCTLMGKLTEPPKRDILNEIIHKYHSFCLNGNGICVTEDYWKSIIIQLTQNDTLTMLFKDIELLVRNKSYQFDPHISLGYLKDSIQKKMDYQKRLVLPSTFWFNSVQCVKTCDEVDGWRTIYSLNLGEKNASK